MARFKERDRVVWRTAFGMTHGVVVKKVTYDMTYDGLHIAASKDDPRYIVRSNSSGRLAAHSTDDLEKL